MTDFSKIGRRSKNKGNYGERRIAKLLTDFTGKNFRRTPGSGGFGKQGLVVAEHVFTGDVISDDKDFQFCIESKNRPNCFSLAHLATLPEKAEFTEWWYHTLEDAKSVNRFPALFFKIGGSSTATVGNDFVALTKEGMEHLQYPEDAQKLVFDVYSKEITFKSSKLKDFVTAKLPTPYIISWRLIAKHVNPSRMFEVPDGVRVS